MAVLELVTARPDWMNALGVAMTRPPGVPERRNREDPWESPAAAERPRRISDDLAWLRQAMDEPADNGLRGLEDTGGGESARRRARGGRGGRGPARACGTAPRGRGAPRPLERLRDRQVLDAAGF